MGSSKPKPISAPFEQQQNQQNTYGRFSIADSPEAQEFLGLPVNYGTTEGYGDAYKDYSGDAYKDLRTKFDIDPGVGRRTDLAEQGAQNKWNSAFMGGIPQEYRQLQRDSELRNIRSQGAAERQQAEYGRQGLEANAIAQQAQMRDASELNRAQLRDASELNKMNAANQIAGQTTNTELERRRILLPQILQTGGSGSSSGYNTQILPGQQGWFGNLLQGAGSAVGGLAAGGFI
jgi:hypothetical protein